MALRVDASGLRKQVADFQRTTAPKINAALTQRGTVEVGRELMAIIPVDTGRYRRGWVVAVRKATGQSVGSEQVSGPSAESDGTATVTDQGLEQVVTVSNNVPYAPELEEGTRQRRPGQYLRRALGAAEQRLQPALQNELHKALK